MDIWHRLDYYIYITGKSCKTVQSNQEGALRVGQVSADIRVDYILS